MQKKLFVVGIIAAGVSCPAVGGPIDSSDWMANIVSESSETPRVFDRHNPQSYELLAQARPYIFGGGEASESWLPPAGDAPPSLVRRSSPDDANPEAADPIPPPPPILRSYYETNLPAFDGGMLYTIDFTSIATFQLGESLWTVLEIGQGDNNDVVIADFQRDYREQGTNFDFLGYSEGTPGYIYLDAEGAGMGVCDAPDADPTTQVDRAYPNSKQNRCQIDGAGGVGDRDVIVIRPDADVWIREIRFDADSSSDGSLVGNGVGIAGGVVRFDTDDQPAEFTWTPAAPFFIAANTELRISRFDEDFVITQLSFYGRHTRNSFAPPSRIYSEELSGGEGARHVIVAVSEPATLGLLLLATLSLIYLRAKRGAS